MQTTPADQVVEFSERLTKLPDGYGPIWRMCKKCHGTGELTGSFGPVLGPKGPKCESCGGKGEVLS